MRSLLLAGLAVSGLIASAPAAAQIGAPGPVFYNSAAGTPNAPALPPIGYDPAGPVYYNQPGPPALAAIPAPQGNPPAYDVPQRRGGRWGGTIDGRWWGGMRAPGGWGSYRRPMRGRALPAYWLGADFRIPDYRSYGLQAPGAGYFWVRYYDDAVLVDGGGRVFDSVGGIAWASAEADAGWGSASAAASASASAGGYADGYGAPPIRPIDPNGYYAYPLGGGAPPVGGAPPAVPYGAPPVVRYQGYAPPAPCPQACSGGGYYGYGGNAGYAGYGYGYGYYGGGVTTIVIQSAPVVTTTTTTIEEVVEEESVATTRYAAPHTKLLRRKTHLRRNCGCR